MARKTLGTNAVIAAGIGILVPNIILSVPVVAKNLQLGGRNFVPLVRLGITAGILGTLVRKMPGGLIKTVLGAGLAISVISGAAAILPSFLGTGFQEEIEA